MLRWIIDHYESYGDRGIVGSNDATETHLELNSLKFAVKQIYNYVKFRKHEDIDKQAPFFAATGNLTWDNFLVQYHNLIAHGLKLSPDVVTSALIAKVRSVVISWAVIHFSRSRNNIFSMFFLESCARMQQMSGKTKALLASDRAVRDT